MFFRPVLFILWSLLSCCCSHGHDYPKEETFDWSIISHEYVATLTHYHNDFKSMHYGKSDIQFAKNLNTVQTQIKDKQSKPQQEKSKIDQTQYAFQQQLINAFALSN
jgi:hypothetical protein